MEGVAKSACDRVELELAAEELPDINPPDILLEMDVFLISWSNIFFWDSSA